MGENKRLVAIIGAWLGTLGLLLWWIGLGLKG